MTALPAEVEEVRGPVMGTECITLGHKALKRDPTIRPRLDEALSQRSASWELSWTKAFQDLGEATSKGIRYTV